MLLDMDVSNKELLYKIVCARDKRYDGRFYCGVRTTGIYCRPICPARPKLKNILFFRSAAEAENAGYRACLRCRPDLAPNSVQWSGTAAVVGRALTMISSGEVDEIPLGHFAEKLGLSDRHLRRLFEEHVGASPIDVATSKRLHLAKHLLAQSSLPVTEIAFASGYRSIRRFNEAFKEKFRIAPSAYRKHKGPTNTDFIRIELPVIAPFDWPHLYNYFTNHAAAGIESLTDGKYRRGFRMGKATGAIQISYEESRAQLLAEISLSDVSGLRLAIEKVRDLFDVRLNPHAHLSSFSSKDPVAGCYLEFLGLRIPGAWDSYETAVCIILSQLVSVPHAREKIKKLVEQFGDKIEKPIFPECAHLFPRPEILAGAGLKTLGITKTREFAIRELSRLVAEKQIDLSRSADIENAKKQLHAIRGVGPWTVEMIAMRCLGDTNAFPKTDLIVKRALEHHKNLKGDWSPWNAYIALALMKKYFAALSKTKMKLSTEPPSQVPSAR